MAPFATDLYLPSFPQISTELVTSATGVQLSLTAFLIGSAVGQVFFGPLSDKVGRRVPLLVGTLIYVLASAATALSPSVEFLVAMRLVQGLSGAAGMVIGRAVISDQEKGPAAARAFSLMMIVGGIAPVIAPFVGSILADTVGWRGLLWTVAGLGLIALICSLVFVPETHSKQQISRATPSAPDDQSISENAHHAEHQESDLAGKKTGKKALLSRPYLGATLAFAFGFSTMMAYISASPFIYQSLMGLSTLTYGLAFGANALLLMIVSIISVKLTRRFAVRSLTVTGLTINIVAIMVFTLIAFSDLNPLLLLIPLLFSVGSLGLVLGNATSLALGAVPHIAGTGSALLGFLQFGLAGLLAPLVSLGGETNPVPLALTMLVSSVVANIAIHLVPKER